MAEWCDVVVENFKPGAAKKYGLTYQEFRKIKPEIIMLSSTNQGQTGPHSSVSGYGFSLCALCGLTNITGWSDREPCHPFGALTDFLTPVLSAICLIGALEYRRRTGKGQYIDVSQFECGLLLLSPILLDCIINGHEFTRSGNSCPSAAIITLIRVKRKIVGALLS